MIRISSKTCLSTLALAIALTGGAVSAETLLVDRVEKTDQMDKPGRGMTMAQVEARFGAPLSKLAPVAGDRPQHPPITRWEYPGYMVYFEHDHVITSVVNRATAQELGPKPAN